MSEVTMDAVRARRQSERGAALLVAVLMLALMATIGFASLNTVQRDREVAGNTNRSQAALYAADAGIAASLEVIREDPTADSLLAGDCLDATVPTANLGNGSSHGPDTTLTAGEDAICMTGAGERCLTDTSLPFQYKIWSVRAQGDAAGSSVARVQATIGRCHPY